MSKFLDFATWLVLGNKRIDHGPMYVCVLCALMCVSISMMYIGTVPTSVINDLPALTQDVLALCMFVGSGICLAGASMGSIIDPVLLCRKVRRRVKGCPAPPTVDVRLAYWTALCGLPAVMISMASYSWTIIANTTNWPSAFSNALAGFICLGCLLHGLRFQLEIRRINRTLPGLIAEVVAQRLDTANAVAQQVRHDGEV